MSEITCNDSPDLSTLMYSLLLQSVGLIAHKVMDKNEVSMRNFEV